MLHLLELPLAHHVHVAVGAHRWSITLREHFLLQGWLHLITVCKFALQMLWQHKFLAGDPPLKLEVKFAVWTRW